MINNVEIQSEKESMENVIPSKVEADSEGDSLNTEEKELRGTMPMVRNFIKHNHFCKGRFA